MTRRSLSALGGRRTGGGVLSDMRRILGFAAAVAASLLAGGTSARGEDMAQADRMAITGVAVVDVEMGAIVPEQTVLIAGGVIEALAPADEAVVPAGACVIDGRGLYLMPGLVDAHAHYFERETFGRLYVASGVTLVRDMGMANELIFPLRAEIAGGSVLGPELLTSGAILDGAPPLIPLISRGVATPDEARQAVRDQAAAGVLQRQLGFDLFEGRPRDA